MLSEWQITYSYAEKWKISSLGANLCSDPDYSEKSLLAPLTVKIPISEGFEQVR